MLKANSYSALCDGSVTEQEMIFVLFLQDSASKLRYFSTENVGNTNAVGILLSINPAFGRFGILNFKKHLLGLNCDCAAVNK